MNFAKDFNLKTNSETMELDKILKLTKFIDKIKINENLCITLRTRNRVKCDLCIKNCPTKAIDIENSIKIK